MILLWLTKESVEDLDLRQEIKVEVIVESSSVMIAKEYKTLDDLNCIRRTQRRSVSSRVQERVRELKKKLILFIEGTQECGTESPLQWVLEREKRRNYVDIRQWGTPLHSRTNIQNRWPSFTKPLNKERLVERKTGSISGRVRTEVKTRAAIPPRTRLRRGPDQRKKEKEILHETQRH